MFKDGCFEPSHSGSSHSRQTPSRFICLIKRYTHIDIISKPQMFIRLKRFFDCWPGDLQFSQCDQDCRMCYFHDGINKYIISARARYPASQKFHGSLSMLHSFVHVSIIPPGPIKNYSEHPSSTPLSICSLSLSHQETHHSPSPSSARPNSVRH
jgi:hypothetical protein